MRILKLALAVVACATLAAPCLTTGAEQRTIEIRAKRFAFSPSEITLKRGETVTLSLTSDDVSHSLLIPGLNVNAAIAKSHTAEVQVTPGTAGDFPGRCGTFCGSGHGTMRFQVHVTE